MSGGEAWEGQARFVFPSSLWLECGKGSGLPRTKDLEEAGMGIK